MSGHLALVLLLLTTQQAASPSNQPSSQPSGIQKQTPPATLTPSRDDLEREKLQLEIANLRRWWAPWAPFLPAAFTGLAVIVAFITAWRTGVFESRNNALRADNALLEAKKLAYEAEIARFQEIKKTLIAKNAELEAVAEFSAFLDKLKSERSVTSGAVDDLVAVVARQDKRGQDRVGLVTTIFKGEDDVAIKSLLSYVLYLGTKREHWRDTLFKIFNTSRFDDEGSFRAVADILGDKRWPDDERLAVCRAALQRIDAETTVIRQLAILTQVGKLHIGAMFNYEHQGPAPTTSFRLDSKDADLFLKAVIIGRGLALEKAAPDAFVALSQFSPPAFLAIVSKFIDSLDFSSGVAAKGPASTLQSCVNYANENVHSKLRGPEILDPRDEGLGGHYPDEFRSSAKAGWAAWRDKHMAFVSLWLERNLDSLRKDMGQYGSMFYHKYVNAEPPW